MISLDLEQYTYWLVIVLMMTGLYVVLARSNMIKTLIGLNMFQVAVIMFYVSMGKVSDGTAPIEIPQLTAATEQAAALLHEARQSSALTAAQLAQVEEVIALTYAVSTQLPEGNVSDALEGVADRATTLLAEAAASDPSSAHQNHIAALAALDHTFGSVNVYSNPLPHVLMLTAIVVGIATISLALALVVRINEAYDTIEEDELLALESRT